MSNVLDRPHIADLKPEALEIAMDEVLSSLIDRMKPKSRAKAVAELQAHADNLDNCGRAGKVVRIRAPRPASSEEQQRIARAAAIRYIIGRAF